MNYCPECGEPACFCTSAAKRPSITWNGMDEEDGWGVLLARCRPEGSFGHINPDDEREVRKAFDEFWRTNKGPVA